MVIAAATCSGGQLLLPYVSFAADQDTVWPVGGPSMAIGGYRLVAQRPIDRFGELWGRPGAAVVIVALLVAMALACLRTLPAIVPVAVAWLAAGGLFATYGAVVSKVSYVIPPRPGPALFAAVLGAAILSAAVIRDHRMGGPRVAGEAGGLKRVRSPSDARGGFGPFAHSADVPPRSTSDPHP